MNSARPAQLSAAKAASFTDAGVDLVALSRETGVSLNVLRIFAAVSDPKNKKIFSASAARKAFARVKV